MVAVFPFPVLINGAPLQKFLNRQNQLQSNMPGRGRGIKRRKVADPPEDRHIAADKGNNFIDFAEIIRASNIISNGMEQNVESGIPDTAGCGEVIQNQLIPALSVHAQSPVDSGIGGLSSSASLEMQPLAQDDLFFHVPVLLKPRGFSKFVGGNTSNWPYY
jgi:hypothetical protein